MSAGGEDEMKREVQVDELREGEGDEAYVKELLSMGLGRRERK